MQKAIFVAMETDRLCLSPAVQDVLHEQRHAEDRCVGPQSAAITQTAQTHLQTNTTPINCSRPRLFVYLCLPKKTIISKRCFSSL